MSGPITTGFLIAPHLVVLAEAAMQEARAMRREYGDVLAQLKVREAELANARAGQRAARLERLAASRADAERETSRLERLRAIAAGIPQLAPRLAAKTPVAPAVEDDTAWVAYAGALAAAADELEKAIAAAGNAQAAAAAQALAAASAGPSIDAILRAYVIERQSKPGLDAADAERFRETAARILSRLQSEAGIPRELEALAREIVVAPSVERAEALALELRHAVQRLREAREAQPKESEEARRMLAELPADAPAALQQALERVAAGVERMDAALRKSALDVLEAAAADRASREQQAAAYVLQESLRDLGYEVEDIEATLFGDGGTVHFTRPGWESYFVRMRVNPGERTANFNVVRASGDEDTPERRRLDALAEDRWCAEFPRLMQTLATRGITLDVTRRLDAGAVPVQVVDAASLPAVRGEERERRSGKPQAKRLT